MKIEVKKKETVRISKKDLARLLNEHEHMSQQITELQVRLGELLEENRKLKETLETPLPTEEDWKNAPEDWGPGPGRSPDPNDPLPINPPMDPFDQWGPDVFIDGASRFRNE